jgi:glycosyltransferase involved in cell wall biosynthesis
MKKIIIISNTSWSLFNFRFELAKQIKENGYEVILVAPYDEYSDRLSKEFEYHNICMNNRGVNIIEDIKTTLAFYKLYKQIKPDMALHYTIKPNIYGTVACDFLNIKTVNNIAGLGVLFIKQNFITKIAIWLYKYSQSKADKIFFQNRDDFEMFVGKGIVEKNKSDILPGSGVDTQRFLPVEHKGEAENFVFLFVARMLWDKGVGEYIEASKIIKDKYTNVEFQMLGFLDVNNKGSVSNEEVQEWIDAGYINYLGVSDNVREEIAKSDCIVLPSFYREGTPRVLLEGASMAKPIITTDNVGCRDVVDDGVNGYLCEVRNAKDLANKMEMMINLSLDSRIVMGKRGREKMRREFDESIIIKRYLEVITKILK